MIRPDDHLAALFAQDLPAARDPAFSVAVLEAAARRRFQQDLVLVGLASLAGALGLAVLWPVLQPALQLLARDLGPTCLALATAAGIVAIVSGRVGADLRFR
ncbi:MAG: hypothetical protein KA085_02520 [Phenylobacterium sp.]|uniref:hypothetical protein n=1 Tax=Phenylobacterium sp. TaxID=1871053 RepID=UPI001B783703|nr:hypothetical protein [Phenylobacterium sp.]MBP7814972.1 hypothetical protein [Phenylobacterium sp.]MBP9230083.1 hypothetical protein [Phenylobacterium sp.]MBP9755024.1 hypothetical protein [Phenylobacterium sp.]